MLEKSESKQPVPGADSAVDAWHREWALLSSVPGNIAGGIELRARQMGEHKLASSLELLGTAALGALLAVGSAKSPALSRKVAYYAPKILGAITKLDLATRVAPPVIDTWRHADSLAANQRKLGNSLGAAVLDYSLMYGSGLASFKSAPVLSSPIGRGLKKLPKLTELQALAANSALGSSGNLGALVPRQISKGLGMFVPSTRMMLIDESRSFSLAKKEIASVRIASKGEFAMAREFKPSEDVLKLYRDLFPARERLPVAELTNKLESGTMALHVSRNNSGQATAFSVVSLPNPAHRLQSAHLDYLGVDSSIQAKGLGSSHMRELKQWIETTFPDVKSTTFFIESRSLESLSLPQAFQRERRAAFYSRLGAEHVGYPRGPWPKDEAPVELWAFKHGQGMLNKEQAAIDGRQRFKEEFL